MTDDLSRRAFMVRGALYGGALALSIDLPRPRAARAAAATREPAHLDPGSWALVEAISERILPERPGRPGRPARPGARTAGCVNFIDKALAHEDAKARPVYRLGLAGVEAVSRERHEASFVRLTVPQQDALLCDLEDGRAAGWPEGPVSSPLFFATVRAHTIIGFLADPKYGGNRSYAGWRLTGYPGPAHHHGGYTPAQLTGKAPIRAVWGEDLQPSPADRAPHQRPRHPQNR
ncbi:MAG: gluconate 2-dehydrogenase subunit 3 family protein [Myxococcota bacterium]